MLVVNIYYLSNTISYESENFINVSVPVLYVNS